MSVRTPSVLTLMKTIGMDFVRVDMEHTTISLDTVSSMAALARALPFGLCVRVPSIRREWITRVLDAGVTNIYVPQIRNAEMVEKVVEAARYEPLGNRGTFEPGPQNDYEEEQNLVALNQRVQVSVMLESPEAFRNIDEIASVEGIDTLAMGPADLAQELGVYGHPDESSIIDEYRFQLRDAARKHGKFCEMGVWSLEDIDQWVAEGAHALTYLTDTLVVRAGFSEAVTRRTNALARCE